MPRATAIRAAAAALALALALSAPLSVHAQAVVSSSSSLSASASASASSSAVAVAVASSVSSSSQSLSATVTGSLASSSLTGTATATTVANSSGPVSLSGGGVALKSQTASTAAPAARFGAAAQLIYDQGVILFFGGVGGTWNSQTDLSTATSIVALSLSPGFTAGGGSWISVTSAALLNNPSTAVDPRLTSYGASVAVRSSDINVSGDAVDIFVYLFGNSANPSTSALYLFDSAAPNDIYTFDNQVSAASPRVRTAFCLLDKRTVIIHGGENGPDNSASTSTLQGTYFLDIYDGISATSAWTPKSGSSSDPLLHDHVMACVQGTAYMLSGITGTLSSSGEFVAADMTVVYVYTYDNDITGGSWVEKTTVADSIYGYPVPRRSATLTPLSSTSSILLLHGGAAVDVSTTYNDLWQLDTSTLQWKQLSSSPYARHSHNAVMVSNYLVTAFGVVSNASSPSPVVPQLVAYSVDTNRWGNLPSGVFSAQTPPAYPSHSGSSGGSNNGGGGGNGLQLSTPVIGGIAGGIAALLVIIVSAVVFRRRRNAISERKELEQKMADRLHREDTDGMLALQGILGASTNTPAGRQVGGELARVIRHNQTGVREPDDEDDDGGDGDSGTEDSSHVYKFGMKVQLKEDVNTSSPGFLDAHRQSAALGHQRSSYVSGLSYPSASGTEESTDSDYDSEVNSSQIHSSLQFTSANATQSDTNVGSPSPSSGTPAVLTSTADVVKKARTMLVETVSKRSSTFPKDEPLRPWELPGMGTQRSPSRPGHSNLGMQTGRSNSRNSRSTVNGGIIEGRNSRSSYVGAGSAALGGESPRLSMLATNSAAISDTAYGKASRQSVGSALSGGDASAVGSENFDETEYMRSLFAQFTDEQILESWNAYVAYTGQIYKMEQIVSLRAIYGGTGQSRSASAAMNRRSSPSVPHTSAPSTPKLDSQ
ncbi:hypothetical protein HDU83_003144 [Entophlyctis luteolus]|nr:hypothetical protein HDU83_003144 [Entophlyctis luteolus]